MKPGPMLWLSDARGIYIPRDFASCFVDRSKSVTGVTPETWAVLDAGPDHRGYWDAWSDVLNDAVVRTLDPVVVYTLHQDGDLWLIPVGMSYDDDRGWFWPEDESAE